VANIKSQKKRVLTNAKAQQRNKAVKSEIKTALNKAEAAIAEGDADAARQAAHEAGQLLDRAASKGVIHKNQAANRKSGIMRRVSGIES